MVSKVFFKIVIPHYRASLEAKDPEGLDNLEPRGMIGTIYVGDHQAMLYTCTKYISCGPLGHMVME